MRFIAVMGAVALFAPTLAAPEARAAVDGTIGIQPARVEATVTRGGQTPAIRVSNNTDRTVEVQAQPYEARQSRSGMPIYDTTPAGRRRGDALLRVSSPRFTIAPHRAHGVRATVLACPQVGRGTYAVMEFSVREAGAAAAARGGIAAALRLSAPLLLAYSAKPCIDGRVSAVRAEQTGDGRLTFFADVQNTGELHAKPATRLRVMRGSHTVFSGRPTAENVLPRATREFALPLRGRLAAGDYRLVADVAMGGRRTSVSRPFHLTAANTLPTPALRLGELHVSDATPGHAPRVTGTLRNVGTASGGGVVRIALAPRGAGTPQETRTLRVPPIAADDSHEFAASLSPLDRGTWTVTAAVEVDRREIDRASATFAVSTAPPILDRVRDWAAAHVVALLAGVLVVLTLLAVLGGLLLLARRRRSPRPAASRSSADELAAIRAALARLEGDAVGRDDERPRDPTHAPRA